MIRRAEKRETVTAIIHRWLYGPGFAVDEIKNKFKLPTRYVVVRRLPGGEHVVSRHRNRTAADRIASRFALPNHHRVPSRRQRRPLHRIEDQ
jgi:hypothetical protein